MRSLRSTLALILVLGALVGYIYYLNKDESSGTETKEKAFASVKAEDIEDVQIKSADGQTSRVLNADGTAWTVLLPMCDGDVSDLEGVRPFDRMMAIRSESPATPKSTFTVWGTNHNFYNT